MRKDSVSMGSDDALVRKVFYSPRETLEKTSAVTAYCSGEKVQVYKVRGKNAFHIGYSPLM
jgi:hypothetical protein